MFTVQVSPPSYSSQPSTINSFQIAVDYDLKMLDEIGIKQTIINEAKKSSLMGMAFINKLALDNNNTLASQISSIYEGYRNSFVNRNNEFLLKTCQKILDDEKVDSLVTEMALYIKNSFEYKKSFQNDGKCLAKSLMPFVKQTIQLKAPKVISKERIVKIPEMENPHNAFPDLIKHNNFYYAAFREAQSHVSYEDFGKIRILKGEYLSHSDQWKWENVALLSKEPYDLRDPKFIIDHQNKLSLIVDGSIISKENTTEKMIPHVVSQIDNEWTIQEAKVDISTNGDKGQWIWRVTWNHLDQSGYGFSYGKNNVLTLMKTGTGINYEKVTEISTDMLPGETLTEATIRFKADGKAITLIRTQKHGLIGTSNLESNYTNWTLNKIPFRLGGPNFVFSKNEEIMWAGTRHLFLKQDNTLDESTIIARMDERKIIPLLRLDSNLDCSYPGMVLDDNECLTVLYYSSEPGSKSNILVTRVQLPF